MAIINQYEQPPKPSKWTGEYQLFYTRLMDLFDDIFARVKRLETSSTEIQTQLATQVAELVTQTAQNTEDIADLAEGGTPVVVRTKVSACQSSGTWVSNYNGGNPRWFSGNDVYQGYTGTHYHHIGVMWFSDLSSLTGKTLSNAYLTLKRDNNTPVSFSIGAKIGLVKVTNTDKSSTTLNYTNVSSSIGTLAKDEMLTMEIPVSVVSELIAGTVKGIGIRDYTGATYYSGIFSKYYCKCYGKGSSYPPVLTVEYTD